MLCNTEAAWGRPRPRGVQTKNPAVLWNRRARPVKQASSQNISRRRTCAAEAIPLKLPAVRGQFCLGVLTRGTAGRKTYRFCTGHEVPLMKGVNSLTPSSAGLSTGASILQFGRWSFCDKDRPLTQPPLPNSYRKTKPIFVHFIAFFYI